MLNTILENKGLVLIGLVILLAVTNWETIKPWVEKIKAMLPERNNGVVLDNTVGPADPEAVIDHGTLLFQAIRQVQQCVADCGGLTPEELSKSTLAELAKHALEHKLP